jgi:glycosyltransferase involved in cell wall biosynthesis
MACGKAVVLSNIDGLWNHDWMVDGETVILTPPGNVYQLAEKVELLVKNPALAACLGMRSRAVVEEHLSSSSMAEAMANILERA